MVETAAVETSVVVVVVIGGVVCQGASILRGPRSS